MLVLGLLPSAEDMVEKLLVTVVSEAHMSNHIYLTDSLFPFPSPILGQVLFLTALISLHNKSDTEVALWSSSVRNAEWEWTTAKGKSSKTGGIY